MKSFVGAALLGAAGLLALSLSAHAAGSTSVTDIAVIKSLKSTQYMLARGADSVPGGGGLYKKSKKKKPTKKDS